MTHTDIVTPNNESCEVIETSMYKMLKSDEFNYLFNFETGEHMRWGETEDEDPLTCPFGPEIADIEVSTICHGVGKVCSHCYKSNTSVGENMSFDTFRTMFDKFPASLTQIAFGIGDIDSNPDLYKMMDYCRNNGHNKVIPNITVNGDRLTKYHLTKLSKLCGAVAVSLYDKDITFNAIKDLKAKGLHAVNMHVVLSEENYDNCLLAIDGYKNDDRLKDIDAIVFLSLKPKGRGTAHHPLSKDKFKNIVDICVKDNVSFGFDSCTSPRFLDAIKNDKKLFDQCVTYVESCESSRMSAYINVKGEYWHCSFAEGHSSCTPIDVVNCNDFLEDVWYTNEVQRFRVALFSNHIPELADDCYGCPVYPDLYEIGLHSETSNTPIS